MRVKICGITNLTDAIDAIEAGADALGFVFYKKSARYITPQDAKKIIDLLPPFVQTVGLFVNETPKDIDNICDISGVDIAQIHFEINDKFTDNLKTKPLKVVRVKSKEDLEEYPNDYKIVDAFVENYGGEGKRIELSWFDNIDCSKIIIAGGLTTDILDQLKPYNFYGFDVSSGVEKYKGKKDKQKMYDFVHKAKQVKL
jgi:phosphoribosylanthranilate isomerase